MKVPVRYIIGLVSGLCLGLAVFMAILFFQVGIPTGGSAWAFAMINKKKAIADSIQGPRLLVVAGSGALYGINAQLIEQQTGRRTVNMGSHAGLGVEYILHVIRGVARPGDTILLALEYEMYSGPFGPEVHDDFIISRDPAYFHQMSWLDKIDMATRLPYKRFQSVYKLWRVGEYEYGNADHVDDFGDEINNMASSRNPSAHNMQISAKPLVDGIPSDDTHGFDVLRSFLRWCQDNHITVLATFPNTMRRPAYDKPAGRHAIEVITHFYANQGVPVIGTAPEAMLPADEFFDTIYHLTHEAALRRTSRLIPELKPWLVPSK